MLDPQGLVTQGIFATEVQHHVFNMYHHLDILQFKDLLLPRPVLLEHSNRTRKQANAIFVLKEAFVIELD